LRKCSRILCSPYYSSSLSPKLAERQPYFEETAARRNSTTTAVEKDFRICWTLKHLFQLETIPELRFKAGTSLSKAFGLIDRFAEDIDISTNRAALGFSGERDLANPRLSVGKRRALGDELGVAITAEVNSKIRPKLHDRFEGILGKQGWELSPCHTTERGCDKYPTPHVLWAGPADKSLAIC
jgi:hypothetical protein